jgi:signal peptidase I
MRRVTVNHGELIELLTEVRQQDGSLALEAHGSSMSPFVHDGDSVILQPVEIDGLQIGDVVAYRRFTDQLVVHRIVGKRVECDRLMFVIRGDRLSSLCECVSAEQVLGKVSNVSREGRVIHIDRGFRRAAALLWIRTPYLRQSGFRGLLLLKCLTGRILLQFQGLRQYRALFRRLVGKTLHYRIADETDRAGLSKLYGHENARIVPDDPHRRTRILVALISDNIVGAVKLVQQIPETDSSPYPEWWIFSLIVRMRYRGSGVGEHLMREALQIAAKDGAATVNLYVYRDNKPALALYHKLGFLPVPNSEIEEPIGGHGAFGTRRRISMSLAVSRPSVGVKNQS